MEIAGDGFSQLAFKTAKIRLWKSDKRFQELCFPGLFFVYYLLCYFRSFTRSFKEMKSDSILRTVEWITAQYKAEVPFNCHYKAEVPFNCHYKAEAPFNCHYKAEVPFNCHYDPAFKGVSN